MVPRTAIRTLVLLTGILALTALVPRMASGKLPPLIPRDLLLGNPPRVEPKLSPDGQHLSWLAPSPEGVMNIWVEASESDEPRMMTSDTGQGIWAYGWAHDGRHLLYVQDRDGDENWHLHATDLTTGQVRDLTPFPGVAAQNLMTSRHRPGEVLVALNKEDRSRFDLYRIDLATGELALEAENPGDVSDWSADLQLRIRGATVLDTETSDTILRVRDAGGSWRDLVRWPFDETGSVLYDKILGFTADGTGMYVQSPMGGDKTRLVVLDTKTGDERSVLAADDGSDLGNFWWNPVVLFHPQTHEPQAVLFDYLIPEWRVLDTSLEEDFRVLGKLAAGGIFMIESRDHRDRQWIINCFSDVQPSVYYLYDRKEKKAELLFESMPALKDYTLAPMQAVTYTARDGLTIPAYLTLPPGVEAKSLPLILHPHGGPWARDYWGFDPWVQLLANRGYAVLQPNFRGSTGYGKAYLNASTEQWGVGSMQHDLTDGVRWAIEEGIADPQRVGIFGGSYGGYTTLAGVTFTPELYTCAISAVGPSNVATLFESFPPHWQVRKLRWRKRVGPVEEDPEFNRRMSPLFHADRIRAPLLVGHGANDPRVRLSESEAIVEAARKNDVPVDFVVYPDEGHGWNRPENNLDWMGRVEEFLAEHLGGRVEPWKPVDGASAQVR